MGKRKVLQSGSITIGPKRKNQAESIKYMNDAQCGFIHYESTRSKGYKGPAVSKFRYHDRALKEHRVMKRHQVKQERATAQKDIKENLE